LRTSVRNPYQIPVSARAPVSASATVPCQAPPAPPLSKPPATSAEDLNSYLLPSSVQEWVPEGDMAHFISDIVDALDLSEIEAVYEEELRGYPP